MKPLIALVLLVGSCFAQSGLPIIGTTTQGSSGAPSATFSAATQLCAAASNTCTGTQTSGHAVVVITMGFGSTAPTCSISDGTNTYTKTTSSPFQDGSATHRAICAGYRLATSSGSTTWTATWGGTGINNYAIFVVDATFTGTFGFDKDAAACSTGTVPSCTGGTAATPVTNPSITPSATGELLLGTAFMNGSFTACGGTWTGLAASTNGIAICYILSSAAGSTANSVSSSANPDTWSSFIGAFN